MFSIIRGKRPLSVMALLTDEEDVSPGMLSGFRNHYLLICRSITQAILSAPSFRPDVVIVDQNIASRDELLHNWPENAGEPVFIALSSSGSKNERLPLQYQFQLTLPVSGGEVENLLAEIRGQLGVRPSLTLSSA
jgi:hypothetical protein